MRELFSSIGIQIEKKLASSRFALSVAAEKTNVLSPLSVLSRGYSLAERNGEVLKSVDDVSVGDQVSVRFLNGRIVSTVQEKIKNS